MNQYPSYPTKPINWEGLLDLIVVLYGYAGASALLTTVTSIHSWMFDPARFMPDPAKYLKITVGFGFMALYLIGTAVGLAKLRRRAATVAVLFHGSVTLILLVISIIRSDSSFSLMLVPINVIVVFVLTSTPVRDLFRS